MITLIGTTHTTIGFGLTGIKDIHEVSLKASQEELEQLIQEAEHDIVMIDELLLEKVTVQTEKTLIKIPYRNGEAKSDFIEDLMKNTIGVVKQWEK